MSRVKFSSLSQADLERYLEDLSLSAASDPGIQVVEVTVPESEVQSVMEVAKEAARRCEELSSSAKVKYEKMAADDKLRYEKEKHNFDGDRGQDDGSDLINNDDQHEETQDTDCKVCKQSPCLSGQFLTESIKDPVGLRVKAIFKSSKFQGKCGTVVSYKYSKMDIFLNILWEQRLANPHKYQQFTFLANEEPKFIIECQPHLWSLPSAKLYENISNTTCCYCGKELSLTVSTSASVTFEKNFHNQAYCVNPQAISNHYTNIIKSAIQCIIHSSKKNQVKKSII